MMSSSDFEATVERAIREDHRAGTIGVTVRNFRRGGDWPSNPRTARMLIEHLASLCVKSPSGKILLDEARELLRLRGLLDG